jgi:hypothetical protein
MLIEVLAGKWCLARLESQYFPSLQLRSNNKCGECRRCPSWASCLVRRGNTAAPELTLRWIVKLELRPADIALSRLAGEAAYPGGSNQQGLELQNVAVVYILGLQQGCLLSIQRCCIKAPVALAGRTPGMQVA